MTIRRLVHTNLLRPLCRVAWFAICCAVLAGCSSGDDGAAPATTETVPLTETELAAFDKFVDSGVVLDGSTRRCLAVPFLRAFGVDRLQSFGVGTPLSHDEAERTYDLYKACRNPLAIFNGLYPANRTVDQSRCIGDNGPSESDAKPLIVAALEGKQISLSDKIKEKAESAVAKCTGANATTTTRAA